MRLVDTPADLERAYDLARRYDDHPLHDMLYVAVAERTQTALITADEQLRSRLAAPLSDRARPGLRGPQ